MQTFSDLIDRWESVSAFAAEVGVPYGRAAQWRRRNSIPSERWKSVIAVAQGRGFFDVTLERLADMAETRTEAAE